MKRNRKIRIGVVGGRFGATFQWHEHPGCIVQAVCEGREDRREELRRVYRCDKAYSTLDELLQDKEVDAVALFTAAPDHARHSVACLNAGKHVMSAVPAATTLEDAELLAETVRKTGLTYMMAETSYYHQVVISARKFYEEGKFGQIFYTEAEYHHAGMEPLTVNPDGSKTWRHGLPPMLYPTHCTGYLVGVTRERLVSVMCLGWDSGDPFYKPNQYDNPFQCQTALFKTDRGNAFRVCVFWYGAHRGTERGRWCGEKMSLFGPHPNGLGPVIVRASQETERDDAGFIRQSPTVEAYDQRKWWETELLPEPLRHGSGHDGTHSFLTHEFIDALQNDRAPAIDIREALAMTVPGIIAHASALAGGKQMEIPTFFDRCV